MHYSVAYVIYCHFDLNFLFVCKEMKFSQVHYTHHVILILASGLIISRLKVPYCTVGLTIISWLCSYQSESFLAIAGSPCSSSCPEEQSSLVAALSGTVE